MVNTTCATIQRAPLANGKYRSPLRYPGGKQKAVNQIFAAFPKSADEYREPLFGGGSVYFCARSMAFAKSYWINDKFKELVSFWRVVQKPKICQRLQKELEELRASFDSAEEIKKFFLQVRLEQPTSQYRQALLFFFFNRVTFSGTTRAGGFSKSASLYRFTRSSIELLSKMPESLEGTKITNFDVQDVIHEPGRDVFVFLDPPYFTAKKLYGHGGRLHSFDHEGLAECLRESKHRFLITYGDCDEVRKLYDWANVKSWSLQYGMSNCNLRHESKLGAELFISNY